MAIKHLIFDCDGVLIDSEILATRIILEELKAFDFEMEELAYSERFSGFLTKDILQMLKTDYGLPLPDDFQQTLHGQMDKAFETILEPVPGMPELISSLPLPKNVVSNGRGEHVVRALKLTGLTSYFGEEIFSVDRVENPKPHPDLYLLALQTTGREADDVIVVEDSSAGVQAAKAAGLTVIGFAGASHVGAGHGEKLTALGANFIANDAQELRQHFEHLL
ncbi:MAG: HAD family phosphatase [Bacteroidota bacterium]